MTTALDLASRLVVGLVGPEPTAAESAWLSTFRPAGVILYRRNVSDLDQLTDLCRRLRALLPPEAEIMADHEGGPVSVLDAACGRPPAPWTLGALDDPGLTRAVMRDTARPALEAGVDRLLAPCTDVLTAPDNPIIGARAFGTEPARVARHVAAAVEGIVSTGMRCCLKHWPGHGGTRGDTHLDIVAPVSQDDPAPLLAGLSAGADAIMLGHLHLQGDPMPASVSAAAVARLRTEVPSARLFSDDLTMGALRGPLGDAVGLPVPGRGLCDPALLPLGWFEAAARAGCDTLLCRGIPWTAWPLRDWEVPHLGPDTDPARSSTSAFRDSPASWTEAITRGATPCLSAGTGDLLLWCPACDHRWGTLSEAHMRAAGWQGAVTLVADDRPDEQEQRFEQVIVATHAPLDERDLDGLIDRLEPEGRCVALGHPSLAPSLERRLPAGWRLSAGYDLTVASLAAFIVPDNRL